MGCAIKLFPVVLMRFSSVIIISLFCIKPVYAAEINILVKEKGSGSAIEGAIVVIDNGASYKETEHNGRAFFPDRQITHQVKILANGYETLLSNLHQGQLEFTFYLIPNVFESEGLKVTAERLPEKGSKLTLSTEDITRSAGSGGDPLKAITALPGISPTEEGSAEVYMRGSNGNENITWVNNVPVGYLYHFGGFQSTINPALIKDINVYLGGFPVEYGDALGGVIDAKLRTPKNDKTHYQFDLSTIASSFLVEGPVNEAGGDSYFIAARRSYLDLILSPADATDALVDDDDSDRDQIVLVPRFYDFQALYHHKLNAGYVDSYLFAAGDEMEMEIRNSAKSDPQLAGEIRDKIEYQTAGVTWQQRWNRKWDSITTVAYLHEKNASRIGRDDKGDSFFAHIEEHTLFVQPELRWYPADDLQVSYGLATGYSQIPVDVYAPRTASEDDINFDFTSQKKYRLKKKIKGSEISPYVKYRKQWTERFTTQFGLRHTNIEVTGGFHTHQYSPRVSIEYKLTPDTLLTSSWGKYIQIPEGDQVVEAFGNPSLVMKEAEHRIVGIEHQINKMYHLKAEVYHKPMKNLVIALDENIPPNNYKNRGSGEAYGFDLYIKRESSAGKMGWLSLSWGKSRRTNQITGITRDFSGDQPLTLTTVWGEPFMGNWKRWDWSIKAQVRSGRPFTAVTGRHREDSNDPTSRWIPEFGKHNAERLPTYFKVDLRIGKTVLFNESKLKLYLDLQNVTFNKNVVEYDYGNEYEKIAQPAEITGMSFFPFFGVEVEY